MARREFTVEYEFTSRHALVDNYTRTRKIIADNEQEALRFAGLCGFSEFGAAFNDNCIDWRIKRNDVLSNSSN